VDLFFVSFSIEVLRLGSSKFFVKFFSKLFKLFSSHFLGLRASDLTSVAKRLLFLTQKKLNPFVFSF